MPGRYSSSRGAGQQIKASLAPDCTVAACAKLMAAKDGIVTTSDEVFASCNRQDEILKWALGRTLERATLQLVAIAAAACAVVAVLVVAISGR